MTNRVVAMAAAGLLYVAGAAWLVGFEGESYRRALLARRSVAAVERTPGDRVAVGEVTSVEPAPAQPRAKPPAEPTPSPRGELRAPQRPAPEPPAVAAPKPPADPPPQPAGIRKDEDAPVAALPALMVDGLNELPAAEEARLGNLLHLLILANHGADENSPFQRAVTAATRPIVDLRSRKDVDVTITVLDSNEVNAFSHLGGYVYVTRGLFNLAATEEEFQFVVGHELAHLEMKHAQALVAEATRAGRLAGVGTLPALYHQIAEGYTVAQENAADDWVLERMLRLGHTKRECLAFIRKFEKLSDQQGFRNGRKEPRTPLGAPVQDVDNHYRSLPAAWERLTRLEGRLNQPRVPAAGDGRRAPGR